MYKKQVTNGVGVSVSGVFAGAGVSGGRGSQILPLTNDGPVA